MHFKFGIILSLILTTVGQSHAEPIGPEAMKALYLRVKSTLEHSTLDYPFHLAAKSNRRIVSSEAALIFPQNIDEIATALSSLQNWCEILPLHINIKACVYNKIGNTMSIYLGRKFYQPPQHAYQLHYAFRTIRNKHYFAAIVAAKKGPLGTSNYRIEFEFVALGDKSFGRIHVSDQQSWRSAKAMQVYLTTKGAKKQGISIVGYDKRGNPQYSSGEVALAERNLLRYYFAFAAFFAHASEPDSNQRHEAQMKEWFKQTEKIPQLYEVSKMEYLSQKRRERVNQINLQKQQ